MGEFPDHFNYSGRDCAENQVIGSRILNQARIAQGLLSILMATMAHAGFDTAGTAPTAVECGGIITVDTVLKNDVGPCVEVGLQIMGKNITLNLHGHRVFSNNFRHGAGIRVLNATNVTVTGGTVVGFATGVLVDGGSRNTVNHMTVQSNSEGISVEGSSNGHIVQHNAVIDNFGTGIALRGPVLNTTINKNTVSGNTDGIFLFGGASNNLVNGNLVVNNDIGISVSRGDSVPLFRNLGSVFDLVSPNLTAYTYDTDYRVMPGSDNGDVTGRLVPIDITLSSSATVANNPTPYDTSTSGCEAADYDAAGFRPGDIALIQRGTCTLEEKVLAADNAGASAVVIFNEGQAPNRTTFGFGSLELGNPRPFVVVLSASYAVGFELYNLTQSGPVTVHVVTNTTNESTTTTPATNNILTKNTGVRNATCDGVDKNLNPPCGTNKWVGNAFGLVNQSCVDPDATVPDFVCGPPQTGTGAIAHHY